MSGQFTVPWLSTFTSRALREAVSRRRGATI